MTKSHPRVDEMATFFGWTRTDPNGVRGDVGGRVGTLLCWNPGGSDPWSWSPDGSDRWSWCVGVDWRSDMSRRERKRVTKRADEVLAVVLAPELRTVLQEYQDKTTDRRVEDSLMFSTAGVFFTGQVDPPPPNEIVTIVGHLANLARRIETYPQ